MLTLGILYMHDEFVHSQVFLYTGSKHHHSGGQEVSSHISIPDVELAKTRVSQLTKIGTNQSTKVGFEIYV